MYTCIKYLFKSIHIFPHNTYLHFYLVISGIIVEVPRNRGWNGNLSTNALLEKDSGEWRFVYWWSVRERLQRKLQVKGGNEEGDEEQARIQFGVRSNLSFKKVRKEAPSHFDWNWQWAILQRIDHSSTAEAGLWHESKKIPGDMDQVPMASTTQLLLHSS